MTTVANGRAVRCSRGVAWKSAGDDLRGLVALLLVGAALVVTAVLTHPLARRRSRSRTRRRARDGRTRRRVYLPCRFCCCDVAVAVILEGGIVEVRWRSCAGGFGLCFISVRVVADSARDWNRAIVGGLGVLHGVWNIESIGAQCSWSRGSRSGWSTVRIEFDRSLYVRRHRSGDGASRREC